MVAWAVVRAMEKHAPFRRLMLEDDRIIENEEFDLGVAVALEDDRLATAVVTRRKQTRLAGLRVGATTRRSRRHAAAGSMR